MPVVFYQLQPANSNVQTYNLAKQLAAETVMQFGPNRNLGVGLGPGSCCAAVAVNPGGNYPVRNPADPVAQQYATVFGNSQMLAGGLAQVPAAGLGAHAERAALTSVPPAGLFDTLAGAGAGNTLSVVYVDLTPCGPCQHWLRPVAGQAPPGGAANPFLAATAPAGNVSLHVWWRWGYPANANPYAGLVGAGYANTHAGHADGYTAMQNFHTFTEDQQLTQIFNW